MQHIEIELETYLPESVAGKRLDSALSSIYSDYSREQLKRWITDGKLKLNGKVITKGRTIVAGGEHVTINATLEDRSNWTADAIPLNIEYEDDDIIIINKPVGLVTHPGAGNPNNTLAGALLHHIPALKKVPRAGLIHRLDKNTSGLLVVAKTMIAHTKLTDMMQQRLIKRQYLALVEGLLRKAGTVTTDIGRNPRARTKMAVVPTGKPAITHYQPQRYYRAHTLLDVTLETGRTHQIRVHMAHIKHPIVGDKTYGAKLRLPKGCSIELQTALHNFNHQALHATSLALRHPTREQEITITAPPPKDFADILKQLDADLNANSNFDET